MHHFLAFIFRMKYIFRWGLMRNTATENLQEHSHQTAVVAHCLALIGNNVFNENYNADRVAVLALYHDSPEIITGDMPTPVKYFNPDIVRAYHEVEEISKNKLLSMLPDTLRTDYSNILNKTTDDEHLWKLVKVADKLVALIKCIEERKAGNSEFLQAEKSTLDLIDKLDCREAKYFLEHFIDSFSLSLDQQNN